jgi:uncharacterized protein YihD (DUF1040 family)
MGNISFSSRTVSTIKVVTLLLSAILASGSVVAAFYKDKVQLKDELIIYTDKSVKDLKEEMIPKLNKILDNQTTQTEAIGKIKGKLGVQ